MAPSRSFLVKAGTGIFVTGNEELEKQLLKFEDKIIKKVLKKATREAAKVVAADARNMVPVDSGALEESIRVRSVGRSRFKIGHSVQTGEGFFVGEQYYGGMVEFGTSKMDADPFLRPALYGNEKPIFQRFGVVLRLAVAEAEIAKSMFNRVFK